MRAVGVSHLGRSKKLHLKMEWSNPTGSVKDRTARELLRVLDAADPLRRGTTVIESSSGNLALALATQLRDRECSFVAVVDPKTSDEVISRLRRLGARLDQVTQRDATGGYLITRLARVRELCQRHPAWRWTDQYENLANPLAHERDTGPELLSQVNGRLAAVYVPVSTGGTLAGISAYCRGAAPTAHIVAVDVYGSAALGGIADAHLLTGIGSGRRSSFVDESTYDEVSYVRDVQAFALARCLSKSLGLAVGGSTAATLWAAVTAAVDHAGPEVCLCPDNGAKYARTFYSDDWLEAVGALDAVRRIEGELTDAGFQAWWLGEAA
jgi:cysteine synthase